MIRNQCMRFQMSELTIHYPSSLSSGLKLLEAHASTQGSTHNTPPYWLR